MRKFLPVICFLVILPAAAIADEQPRGSQAESNCMGTPTAGKNQTDSNITGYDGYTAFPIQAPQRYKNKNDAPDAMPDDSVFADSLRMLFGVKGPKPPNCFRQPMERGLLRDE